MTGQGFTVVRMAGARAPEDPFSTYVRERIQGWIKEGHTQAELARLSGIPRSAINSIIRGTTNVTRRRGKQLAGAWGTDYTSLLSESQEWAKSRSISTVEGAVQNAAGFPNRAAALAFASEEVSEEAKAYLLNLAPPRDFPRMQWLELLQAKDDEVRLRESMLEPVKPKKKGDN